MTNQATHIILVCCHAIYLGGRTRGISESEWLLAPFQKGETPTFTSHIKTALSLLASSPSSVLIFSGSKTKPETEKSEARSYWDLCLDNNFYELSGWEADLENTARDGGMLGKIVMLEEQALDSYGNFQFGILRFWKETGKWPEKITIVSHEFKRRRFLDLHVKASRWPRGKVEFVGIDPEYMVRGSKYWDEKRAEDVWRGERERGYKAWESDLMGTGEELRRKRSNRNFWGVGQLWFENEEERVRSGVKSRVISGVDGFEEEVLDDERQPWEDGGHLAVSQACGTPT